MPDTHDWIRDSVANAAESQGLTAYAISKLLDGRPTEETVKRYIAKRCHLGTQHVSRICDVLGLDLRAKNDYIAPGLQRVAQKKVRIVKRGERICDVLRDLKAKKRRG